MLTLRSPRRLLREQLDVLTTHLPGLRDAVPDSVHESRIATRRIRELLGLLSRSDEPEDDLIQDVRRVGKCLGRVRELDVMRAQLDDIERRVPSVAIAAAAARRGLAPRRRDERRHMVKAFERLELSRLIRGLDSRSGDFAGWRPLPRWTAPWVAELRRRIAERAASVAASVDHGSGVYFANRAHATRIAVKKLRYTVEIAEVTGLWRPPRLLKDLKRIQARLGEAHDIQVLLDHLQELAADTPVAPAEIRTLEEALELEVDELHQQYLASRDRLKRICDVCSGHHLARGNRSGLSVNRASTLRSTR